MRIGLIADAHGNAAGLTAVLQALNTSRVDRILFAGDAIGYYPQVNEVVSCLRAHDVVAVLGNHECYLFGRLLATTERWRTYCLDRADRVLTRDNRQWLSALPVQVRYVLDGVTIQLCHGSPWAVDQYVYPDADFTRFAALDADVVVMGHTHIPLTHHAGDVLLVNPGSCGQPRDYGPDAAYAVLDTRSRRVELCRASYDLRGFLDLINSMECPETLMQILYRVKGKVDA